MRTLSGYATDVPKHPTKNRKGAISFNATLNNDRRRCPKSPHSREIETRVIPAAINKKPGGRPMPPRHSMGLPGRTCTEKLQPESENKCNRPSNGQQTPAPSAAGAPASRKTDGLERAKGLANYRSLDLSSLHRPRHRHRRVEKASARATGRLEKTDEGGQALAPSPEMVGRVHEGSGNNPRCL